MADETIDAPPAPRKTNAQRTAEWRAANPEEAKAHQRRWREANRAKIRAQHKAWRERHPERVKRVAAAKNADPATRAKKAAYRERTKPQIKARHKRWRDDNPDKTAKYRQQYRAANPEKVRAIYHNLRAKRRSSEGTYTAADIARILEQQRHRCAYCRNSLKSGYHVDHIVALANGGSNWPNNLQCLCPTCNVRKAAKDALDFARERGLLL